MVDDNVCDAAATAAADATADDDDEATDDIVGTVKENTGILAKRRIYMLGIFVCYDNVPHKINGLFKQCTFYRVNGHYIENVLPVKLDCIAKRRVRTMRQCIACYNNIINFGREITFIPFCCRCCCYYCCTLDRCDRGRNCCRCNCCYGSRYSVWCFRCTGRCCYWSH